MASLPQCSLKEEAILELFTSSSTGCKVSKLRGREPTPDIVSFINTDPSVSTWQERAKPATEKQHAVWVSGYPRSGSSTVLSMVSATMDDNQDPGRPIFSVFEPCHDGDEYQAWLAERAEAKPNHNSCPDVLWSLSRCDFTGIGNLWGWWDPHSTNNHTKFNNVSAHNMCTAADVVAFKTVDFGHDLQQFDFLLDSHPNFRVLDVVRDPRGIYASWMTLEPFATLVKEGFPDTGKPFYTLTEICDHFDMNLKFIDERVHRVVFEELMTNPWDVTQGVYEFLGIPFGNKQSMWIENVFNNTDCPPPPPEMVGFTDCHADSGSAVTDRWRTVLTEKELSEWKNSKSCQRIAEVYNFRD